MDFLAFQEFQPREQRASPNCIWCGASARMNRAHLISRKLSTGARNAPTLRFNVCEGCNTRCGDLEQWVLRFTPLSWVRVMLYLRHASRGTTRDVPSYFFSGAMNEWVVFHLDGASHSYAVATQLLLSPKSSPTLLTQEAPESHSLLSRRIMAAIRDKAFKTNIHESLPAGFSPRILLEGEHILLVSRTTNEAQASIEHASGVDWGAPAAGHMCLENTGREQLHFRWSKTNWARFCAKTAFEALCLFEGGEKCLRPGFTFVRDFVTRGEILPGREVVFDEKGPRSARDVPTPVFLDLTVSQAAPQPIAAVLPHAEAGMHVVALYEVHGWVLASVVVAGFPPSVLVLGGPDEHLDDFYQMIYDDQQCTFEFTRLAYDRSKPIVPMAIPGNSFSDLAETYGLKSVYKS